MQYIKIYISALFISASLGGISQSLPNIIFILADDLGHGEVSYVDTLYSTPRIDSLAANGAKFNKFYATPACTPTRYSLMTGKQAWKAKMQVSVIWEYEDFGIDKEERTLPEYLQENGYQTGMVGKWHLGHNSPDHLPQTNGFDYFYGFTWGAIDHSTPYLLRGIRGMMQDGQVVAPEDGQFLTEDLGDAAVNWIELQAQDASCPFFLYMSFPNPHGYEGAMPIISDSLSIVPPGRTSDQQNKWVNIKIMDNQIGRIVDKCEELGIDSNTIIIFTSDNGGEIGTYPASNSYPFTGLKGYLREGGLREPFVWYHPGTIAAGTEVDSTIGIIDMLPTIIEGVVGSTARDSIVDGVNVYPLLTGGSLTARDYIGYYVEGRQWSVYRGKWKLVNNKDERMTSAASLADNIELFDLDADPTESTDLSGTYPDLVISMQASLPASASTRAINQSKPGGWVDPPYWSSPPFFYNSSFYFTTADYKE